MQASQEQAQGDRTTALGAAPQRLFEPLEPALTRREALVEASRCLYCFDAPCIRACPTGIDVPEFIRSIRESRPIAAARTILEANILGATCARVCPTEVLCEGECVLHAAGERPIAIGRLQQFALDSASEQGGLPLPPRKSSEKRLRVGIVGAGPAGLACAAELALAGHRVTVYDRRPLAGGLGTHGVALYKLPLEVARAEVELVRSLGVEFQLGVRVGGGLPATQLMAEQDAVFLALGRGEPRRLRLPGGDLPGVMDALAFIEDLHLRPRRLEATRVLVIGGGNTAVDAAVQSLRAGAGGAVIAYRGREERLSAYPAEVALARSEGVRFLFDSSPVRILGSDQVEGVVFRDAGSGHESTLPADLVLVAVGQESAAHGIASQLPGLELDPEGTIRTDPETFATSVPRVYAGGDCANGGREVVHAVAEGRRAAWAIARAHGIPLGPARQASRLGAPGGAAGSGILENWR